MISGIINRAFTLNTKKDKLTTISQSIKADCEFTKMSRGNRSSGSRYATHGRRDKSAPAPQFRRWTFRRCDTTSRTL